MTTGQDKKTTADNRIRCKKLSAGEQEKANDMTRSANQKKAATQILIFTFFVIIKVK
jgi:hypothetical protein